jgi:hypothetical protein
MEGIIDQNGRDGGAASRTGGAFPRMCDVRPYFAERRGGHHWSEGRAIAEEADERVHRWTRQNSRS